MVRDGFPWFFAFFVLNLGQADRWADGRMHQGAICGERFINVGNGAAVVKSPHYPSTFGSQIQCVWKVETDAGSRIKLTFTDFKLQLSESCQISYLEIAEDFENSKLCGHVPTMLISRGNKMTMTLHADMASNNIHQRFKVSLSKTYDRPFIPRGAVDIVAGQKANENIINTHTVKTNPFGGAPKPPPRMAGIPSRPLGAPMKPVSANHPQRTVFGKKRMDYTGDYTSSRDYSSTNNNDGWVQDVLEEEEEKSFWVRMNESKVIVVFYLLIIAAVLLAFLCLMKKLKHVDDDDGITDVQT